MLSTSTLFQSDIKNCSSFSTTLRSVEPSEVNDKIKSLFYQSKDFWISKGFSEDLFNKCYKVIEREINISICKLLGCISLDVYFAPRKAVRIVIYWSRLRLPEQVFSRIRIDYIMIPSLYETETHRITNINHVINRSTVLRWLRNINEKDYKWFLFKRRLNKFSDIVKKLRLGIFFSHEELDYPRIKFVSANKKIPAFLFSSKEKDNVCYLLVTENSIIQINGETLQNNGTHLLKNFYKIDRSEFFRTISGLLLMNLIILRRRTREVDENILLNGTFT